jgi:hypothetical protein
MTEVAHFEHLPLVYHDNRLSLSTTQNLQGGTGGKPHEQPEN